ncbi:Esa1p-associated factor [Spiromyces aspiralis]|uniref:Esa1p-associated factor n=1 Tax=Spiromyces aspiralis TaxID=68401 RepID=A0ACC1HLK0_9FUNG|nr:Esa1p-associated factor [Spiromyces aspiralis]
MSKGVSKDEDHKKELSFRDGERILAYHGPLLYEAKVLKAEYWDGTDPEIPEIGPHYYVHYKGWKQTWDEWVDESRTLKWNEENLAKQKLLKQNALAAAAMAKKKAATPKRVSSSSQADSESIDGSKSGRKRTAGVSGADAAGSSKQGNADEKDSAAMRRPEIKVPIPNALKVLLVNDWEYITKDKLLVPLPRSPTVAQLLDNYRAYRREHHDSKRPKRDQDITDEIIEGLKLYFDKALGNLLLYRFERYQYQRMLQNHPSKPMSDIYGAEHLLRLFVQLPTLIAQTNMDDDAVAVLKEYLNDLMRQELPTSPYTHIMYMQKHSKALFSEEYENASPAYVSVAKAT